MRPELARSSGTSARASAPSGGPAVGEDRYVEIWNLVFMQFDAQPDGELRPAARAPSVDTGAGLERNLAVLQGVDSVWDIDVFRPLIAAAETVTGVAYGGFPGGERDVSLRILAEHGRTMTFLVADGVVPSNEERGYVLRRIIRRAVRHAFLLGAAELVTPPLVDATVDVDGRRRTPRSSRRTTRSRARCSARRSGSARRSSAGSTCSTSCSATGDVAGEDAFFLHDTLGFPIDLTREIAEERGRARRPRRLRGAHGASSAPGPRTRTRRVGDAPTTPLERVPRAPRRGRPDRVHRPPGVRDRRAQGARADRRRRAASADA